MPRITIHVPVELERELRAEARRLGLGISDYIVGLLEKRIGKKGGWNEEFFTNVVGGWQGDMPEIPRDPPERR